MAASCADVRVSIDELKNIEDGIIEQLKATVKDKSQPLEERWQLFCDARKGERRPFYIQPAGLDWDKVTLFDDFYIDRYQTVWVTDWYEQCIEMRDSEDIKLQFDGDAFREWILEMFIWSFVNDW